MYSCNAPPSAYRFLYILCWRDCTNCQLANQHSINLSKNILILYQTCNLYNLFLTNGTDLLRQEPGSAFQIPINIIWFHLKMNRYVFLLFFCRSRDHRIYRRMSIGNITTNNQTRPYT